MSETLVPPKPKLFEIAVLTGFFTAMFGVKFKPVAAQSGSRFSRLIVGGMIPSRIARIEKAASIAPAAPSKCPVMDLVELT